MFSRPWVLGFYFYKTVRLCNVLRVTENVVCKCLLTSMCKNLNINTQYIDYTCGCGWSWIQWLVQCVHKCVRMGRGVRTRVQVCTPLYTQKWFPSISYSPKTTTCQPAPLPSESLPPPRPLSVQVSPSPQAELGTRSNEGMKRWSDRAMLWSFKCFITSILLPVLNVSSLHWNDLKPALNVFLLQRFPKLPLLP